MKAAGAPQRRHWPWLLLAGIFGLWFALFEATWLRPLLQRHVLAHSQRNLHFDSLRLGLSGDLQPTARFRGVRIDNAPWADRRPMVDAGEVRFTFAWRTLLGERIIVKRLELVDAQVDLERSADGLRNWRLTRPDDRGPGRTSVQTLEARRSSLRFVHGGRDLEIDATIAALDKPTTLGGQESLTLTKRLVIRGARGGQRFDGVLHVSDVLSFVDSDTRFAVQGDISSLRTRLRIDGSLADLLQLNEVDARLALSGPSLAELNPLLASGLPASRPFTIETKVLKARERTEFGKFAATLGTSDLHGELSVVLAGDGSRRTVDARLAGKSIDFADLPLSASHADGSFDVGALKRLDAKIVFEVQQLKTPAPVQIRHVRLNGGLAGGVLKVDSLRLDGAGGAVAARGTFDSNPSPPRVALTADLDGLQLDQLLPPQAPDDRVAGTVGVHAELQASGASGRAWLRSLSGRITAATGRASISSRLDARLALNGGRLLRTMVEGTEQIPVRCGALELRVRDGVGRTERFVVETDRLKLLGSGSIDLPRQTLAMTLTPQRKQTALLALQRSIRVEGPLGAPRVTLDQPVSPHAAASCLGP